jgi:hypothetical protein
VFVAIAKHVTTLQMEERSLLTVTREPAARMTVLSEAAVVAAAAEVAEAVVVEAAAAAEVAATAKVEVEVAAIKPVLAAVVAARGGSSGGGGGGSEAVGGSQRNGGRGSVVGRLQRAGRNRSTSVGSASDLSKEDADMASANGENGLIVDATSARYSRDSLRSAKTKMAFSMEGDQYQREETKAVAPISATAAKKSSDRGGDSLRPRKAVETLIVRRQKSVTTMTAEASSSVSFSGFS